MNSNAGTFESIFSNGPLQNYQNSSDAVLIPKDGGPFHIHKSVLAVQSEFFRAMFDFDVHKNEFVLPTIERRLLEKILVFIYTNELDLSHVYIPDVLIVTDFLLMERLTKECCSYALKSLDIHTSLPLLDVAWKLKKMHLFESSYRFVQLNFQEVIENSATAIGSLEFELLQMLLAEKSLNISSETTLWQTILFWVEHDFQERSKFVPELLTYLNIENIDESMATSIIQHTIVDQNEFCNAINELKTDDFLYHDILATHMQIQSNPIFSSGQARQPSSLNIVVDFCAPMKWGRKCQIELLITFDEKFDACQKICDLNISPYKSRIINHKLLLLGHLERDVFSWDLEENVRFTNRQDIMSWFISYPYSATLTDGTIYIVEFQGDFDRNNRVERFVPESNRRDFVADMPRMSVTSTLSCGDKIYVFGITFMPNTFVFAGRRLQMYNPETNTWYDMPTPRIARLVTETFAFKNKIFAIGNSQVEEYDPVTNIWSVKPQLPYQYSQPKCIELEEMLCVYEDPEKEDHEWLSNPPVFWDEAGQTWKDVQAPSILHHINRFLIIPINNPETVRRIILNRRNSAQKWIKSPFV